jgi:hypothetical protein
VCRVSMLQSSFRLIWAKDGDWSVGREGTSRGVFWWERGNCAGSVSYIPTNHLTLNDFVIDDIIRGFSRDNKTNTRRRYSATQRRSTNYYGIQRIINLSLF